MRLVSRVYLLIQLVGWLCVSTISVSAAESKLTRLFPLGGPLRGRGARRTSVAWEACKSQSAALSGDGIRGGQVVAASDQRGAYVTDRRVSIGGLYATV